MAGPLLQSVASLRVSWPREDREMSPFLHPMVSLRLSNSCRSQWGKSNKVSFLSLFEAYKEEKPLHTSRL